LKKSELKNIIQPIVEECVKDALLSSGLLSKVISEVIAGVQGGLMTETRQAAPVQQQAQPVPQQKNQINQVERQKVLENKKKLLDAIGSSSYNGVDVFEGTKPLRKGGSTSKGSGGYKAFDGVDPNDPGVDISGLTNNLGNTWKKLAEGKKK
tara:strand:+ start:178 stop:633 length:456 start_codon:yes stop_codon:yes gene_type:complete